MVELVVQWMLEREEPSPVHSAPESPTSNAELLFLSHDFAETKQQRHGMKRSLQETFSDDDDGSSTSSSVHDGAKRARMSLEERRARHREAQRQFAVRKKHQLDAMRKLVQSLEVRHQYLKLTQEIAQLQQENARRQDQYEALGRIRFPDAQEEKKECR